MVVIKKATTPVITTQCIRVPVLDGLTAAVLLILLETYKGTVLEKLRKLSGLHRNLIFQVRKAVYPGIRRRQQTTGFH